MMLLISTDQNEHCWQMNIISYQSYHRMIWDTGDAPSALCIVFASDKHSVFHVLRLQHWSLGAG